MNPEPPREYDVNPILLAFIHKSPFWPILCLAISKKSWPFPPLSWHPGFDGAAP